MPSWYESLLTPNAAYIQAKLEALDAARREYDVAMSSLNRYYERSAQTETEAAADVLARYGALTSTTMAKAAGEIRAQKMQGMADAYATAEFARASARARRAELESMKQVARMGDVVNMGKTAIQIGTILAAAGVGAAATEGAVAAASEGAAAGAAPATASAGAAPATASAGAAPATAPAGAAPATASAGAAPATVPAPGGVSSISATPSVGSAMVSPVPSPGGGIAAAQSSWMTGMPSRWQVFVDAATKGLRAYSPYPSTGFREEEEEDEYNPYVSRRNARWSGRGWRGY